MIQNPEIAKQYGEDVVLNIRAWNDARSSAESDDVCRSAILSACLWCHMLQHHSKRD